MRIRIYVENPGENNDIQPGILKAYNLANEGDIIVLPEGKFSYSNSLEFTKLVSLIGAGKDKTILYRPESTSDSSLLNKYFFRWKIERDSSSHLVISDFTLKSKISAGNDNLGGSLATDYGIIINQAVDFVITDCRFEYFGFAAVSIRHKDLLARGLIYNNQFYHNYKGDGLGLGYGVVVYGENNQWAEVPKFGSENFIFIEDNYFEAHRHAIAGGGCGLYVARYNTIKNNFVSHAIDMHEARSTTGNNAYATRATEIYNNTLSNDTYLDNVPVSDNPPWHDAGNGRTGGNALSSHAIGIRGGEVLIFNNQISYYKYAIVFSAIYHSETGDQNVYPLKTQIGYRSAISFGINDTGTDAAHGDGDAYIWNNNLKAYGPENVPYNTLFRNSNTEMLQENRDYHFTEKPGYMPYTYPHPLRR